MSPYTAKELPPSKWIHDIDDQLKRRLDFDQAAGIYYYMHTCTIDHCRY